MRQEPVDFMESEARPACDVGKDVAPEAPCCCCSCSSLQL